MNIIEALKTGRKIKLRRWDKYISPVASDKFNVEDILDDSWIVEPDPRPTSVYKRTVGIYEFRLNDKPIAMVMAYDDTEAFEKYRRGEFEEIKSDEK